MPEEEENVATDTAVDSSAGAEEALKKQNEEEEKQEVALLQEFIDENKKRNVWKEELRASNVNIGARPDESDFHRLDSSLKKNTAFIRKLKNFTDVGCAPAVDLGAANSSVFSHINPKFLVEMKSLNLTKYVGEVASALVEAKLKMTDLAAAVEICSFMHQTYAEFSTHLLESWQKNLCIKKDERVANSSKLRVDLRFYAELVSVGIFSLKEGLPLLGQVLTTLVALDREEHANIAIVVTFCKHCGDDYAGLMPRKMRDLSDKHRYVIPQSGLLPPEKQRNVRQLLKDYFQSLCKHLVAVHKELQTVERTNRRILLTKGEVHSERKEKVETLQQTFHKLFTNTEQLADLLDEDMPELPKEDPKKKSSELDDADEALLEGEVDASGLGMLWEDDDTKSFYEIMPDLKAFIPAILYKDSAQAIVSQEKPDAEPAKEVTDEELEVELETMVDDGNDEDVAPPALDDEVEEGSDSQNTSSKMLLEAFFAKLPTCVSREMIDTAAVEFCMNLNTKLNRRKLVKALFSVHRNRQDLLPFYSRFVATLFPCMPEVADDLAQYLKQEFRWQLKKKDQMKIESKLKVCRFIGEMVKFKMFPKSEALFCLKQLLFDFSHHHIEMACTLVEACGRFLFRSPDSHQRTKIYLEQMMRKKAALSMDNRYCMMIENAFYIVNPPEAPLEAKARRPPLQDYIARLLYDELNRNNAESVLRQIRKLDWENKEVSTYAIGCLSAIWNVKFYNIRYAASLLAGLVSHHEWVGPQIIDSVLEDIRLHMEINDAKYNQRRTSVVKFFAELYNYRLIDSALVFKVMYALISFGVSSSHTEASPLDPPDNMLRIRLVCVILDTCGIYFNTGTSKKKLDNFFVYFQRYYWRKRASPVWTEDVKFPISITNLVSEQLTGLRTKLKLYASLEDAESAASKIEQDFLSTLKEKSPSLYKLLHAGGKGEVATASGLHSIVEEVENAEELCVDDEAEDDQDSDEEDHGMGSPHSNSRSRSVSRMDQNSQEEYDDLSDELEEEDLDGTIEIDEGTEGRHVPSAPKYVKCEEDDAFAAMFDKMVNDNISESRSGRVQIGMIAPTQAKHKKTFDRSAIQHDTVQFSVLLRKNNKPAFKEVAVPVESDIARNLIRQEEADRREKERVKQLTLEINERQEEEDLNEAIAAMQRPMLVTVNRDRKPNRGHQPPRGAPDASAIFGNAGSKLPR